MILIADAGGTNTSWRLLDGEKITQFSTRGYNPNTHQLSDFLRDIAPTFEEINLKVSKLYFYGASLYPESTVFKSEVSKAFPNAEINVDNDLLGSCRSLSAKKPGFIGILGTGSAGCFYDGKEIVNHVPSLGYSLGDEGSGAYLGRKLLNITLRNRLNPSMKKLFDKEFNLTREEAYKHVYREEAANAYLASFARFLLTNKSDPQIYDLLKSSFGSYFEAYFLSMDDIYKHSFHFTGSIAYYFGDIIREIGIELNLSIGLTVQSPIAGLALYHQENG